MTLPIIVLCFNSPMLITIIDVLSQSGKVEIHAVVGIQIDRRYGSNLLKSITVLPPSPRTDGQTVDIILALAKSINAEALLPVWIDDVAFISKNYDALLAAKPVPVPKKELLEQLVNKLSFSKLANSFGFPTPKTIEMHPTLNVHDTINFLGLPILAKPVIGTGGKGIVEVSNEPALRTLLKSSRLGLKMLLQEKVPGEDVALTLLADKGAVFAVMMRKRWFTRRHSKAFSPIKDVEFFHDSWLEDLGREFVSMTQFSGIADFDLKVEFESRSVWFLESDPRMIGGLQSTLLFGLNIPWLLVEQMHGHLSSDSCVRPDTGYFLSPRSVPEWILRAAWREPRYGPIRSNWGFFTKDPITTIYKLLSPP